MTKTIDVNSSLVYGTPIAFLKKQLDEIPQSYGLVAIYSLAPKMCRDLPQTLVRLVFAEQKPLPKYHDIMSEYYKKDVT